MALWGGRIVSGADRVLEVCDFDDTLNGADLVVTGEGCFDAQSLDGKLVGTVLGRAARAGVPVVVVAGRVAQEEVGDIDTMSLTRLAGSERSARAEPAHWLAEAGRRLARRCPS
jgi:glycerate kinase